MTDKNCVFCKISKGLVKSDFLAESDNFYAILDKNPKSRGHALIISKKHYVTILDIPNKLSEEMISIAKKVSSEIMDKKLGDGFNIVMNNLSPAGQVVMHAHIHIIPRKEDDGLRMIA